VVYRDPDRVTQLEREIDEANATVAELKIEIEVLKARLEDKRRSFRAAAGSAFAAGAVGTWIGLCFSTFAWVITENAGLVFFGILIGLLGGVVVGLSGPNTPTNRPR